MGSVVLRVKWHSCIVKISVCAYFKTPCVLKYICQNIEKKINLNFFSSCVQQKKWAMLYKYGKFLQEQGEQKSWKLRIGKQLPASVAAASASTAQSLASVTE